jgi:hypothetical protein
MSELIVISKAKITIWSRCTGHRNWKMSTILHAALDVVFSGVVMLFRGLNKHSMLPKYKDSVQYCSVYAYSCILFTYVKFVLQDWHSATNEPAVWVSYKVAPLRDTEFLKRGLHNDNEGVFLKPYSGIQVSQSFPLACNS